MNQKSGHQHVEELLSAAALGILEGEDLGQVFAHTAECAECARRLDEYCGAVAALALALPSQPMQPVRSGQLRERLLARARNNPPASTAEGKRARASSLWGGADRWTGWAVAAGLVGVLLAHHGFHRPLAYGWVVAGFATIALVAFGVYAMIQRGRVAELEDRLARLDGDQVKVKKVEVKLPR